METLGFTKWLIAGIPLQHPHFLRSTRIWDKSSVIWHFQTRQIGDIYKKHPDNVTSRRHDLAKVPALTPWTISPHGERVTMFAITKPTLIWNLYGLGTLQDLPSPHKCCTLLDKCAQNKILSYVYIFFLLSVGLPSDLLYDIFMSLAVAVACVT